MKTMMMKCLLSACLAFPLGVQAGVSDLFNAVTGKSSAGTLTIYLIDDTGSPPAGDKQLYVDSVARANQAVGAGDSVIVARLSDIGLERFKASYSASAPKTDRRFEDQRAAKAMRSGVETAVTAILDGKEQPQSTRILDTFSAIAPAIKEARAAGKKVTVVAVSDMVEESDELDMRKQNLDDGTAGRILERRKKLGLVPDLQGTAVYLVGGSGVNARAAALGEKFWRTYLESGCGAKVKFYGRTIPQFL